MQNSLKVLNHFIKNIDKTLKILINRKNEDIILNIENKLKNSKIDLPKINVKDKNVSQILDSKNQLESIQIVLFSLKKYLEYLSNSQSQKSIDFFVEDVKKNILKTKYVVNNNIKEDFLKKTNLSAEELRDLKLEFNDNKIKFNDFKNDIKTSEEIKEEYNLSSNNLSLNQNEFQNKENLKTKNLNNDSLNENKTINYIIPEQKLNETSKATRIPATRIGRILSYGELAAGLGIGTFLEISKRSLGLTDNTLNTSAFFNEANANRIVKTLCKVRGAALKIGQILSIQDIINPELQRIFERVRQSADYMPEYQLKKVLKKELGKDWIDNFEEFDLKPFAAASIGQVHKAKLKDGKYVALKIQYPGVAEGIDSDIKNLVSVLKIWDILPPGLFIDSIIKVTRKELSWELDYEREIEMTKNFKNLVEKHLPDQLFVVPEIVDNLCTKKLITSQLVYGVPIDKLNLDELSNNTINNVAERLLRLVLYEIFIFQFMQTDPNWSNFFYNPKTDQISLIDFGAARSFPDDFVRKYYNILKAASIKNNEQILKHSIEIGFLTGLENKAMINAHIDSVLILGKIFEYDDEFNFGEQDISLQIHKTVPVMLENRLTPPPDEIYSLHRKLSGVFLLLVKLKAKVNCKKLFYEVADLYEKKL